MAGFLHDGSSSTSNLSVPISNTLISQIDSKDVEDTEVEYPANTRPLQNQVAGHDFKDGKRTVGMLKHNDGYVLKPVNRPIQGEKEISFYEKMQKVTDPVLLELKSFIPEYYGTTVLDLLGKKVTFLLLKDITNSFEEPCIMDIKIGKQTWEPGVPIEKQLSEQEKYSKCKNNLCFCIPGFQTYDIKKGTFQKYGKDYGKQLDVNGVYDAMRLFFNVEHGIGEYVLTPILVRLKEILNWWKKQTYFHIYASSVLLAYDAAAIRKIVYNESDNISITTPNHPLNSKDEYNASDSKSNLETWLCVYLIDFAHVVPADKNVPDLNYIGGLGSLIKVLENILTELSLKEIPNKMSNS